MSVYTGKNGKKYWWDPKSVCLHESGHCVVAHRIGVRVTRIAILGSGQPHTDDGKPEGGFCEITKASTAADNIVIGFGGVFATCLLMASHLPNLTDFASDENSHDLHRIRMYRASDPSITDDVVGDLKEQTKNLVLDNERDIRKVARALWKKKLLNEDDIVELLGARTRDNVMTDESLRELSRTGLFVTAA